MKTEGKEKDTPHNSYLLRHLGDKLAVFIIHGVLFIFVRALQFLKRQGKKPKKNGDERK